GPPLAIGPLAEGRGLSPLEFESPAALAPVKAAVLASGLYAEGPTIFREPVVSADHVERRAATLDLPVRTVGPIIQLDPGGWDRRWAGFEAAVPGDLSAAAILVAAAQ